ncbi:MAG: hypothetical protein IMY87_03175 [Chloroflexi bacterium]|jgi:ubiquitin|nr:hypothetical protein [Chloroflexota bacterium]
MAKPKDKTTATEAKLGRRRSKTKAPSLKRGFYAQALSEAEQVLLPEAKEIEGLDEEIALLRVKLTSALEEQPDNMSLMMRGVDLLVKAVAAKYRLSKKSREDLADAINEVLKEIGIALFPSN